MHQAIFGAWHGGSIARVRLLQPRRWEQARFASYCRTLSLRVWDPLGFLEAFILVSWSRVSACLLLIARLADATF